MDFELENTCGAIYPEKDLKAAMQKASPKPIINPRKVYNDGRYPAVSIACEHGDNKCVRIHVLLACYWLGIELEDMKGKGIMIHHIRSKLENTRDSLVICYSYKAHGFLHRA